MYTQIAIASGVCYSTTNYTCKKLMTMNSNLHELIAQFNQDFQYALQQASNDAQLEQVRITFLGRTGKLTSLMANLGSLSLEEKKIFGPLLNNLRNTVQEQFLAKKKQLANQEFNAAIALQKNFDVTAYIPQDHGTIHTLTQLSQELGTILTTMGFAAVTGPEVETEFYNFTALNIPADHPARQEHDTFWLSNPGMLLRTHTSTMQLRAMQHQKPPIAIYAPGRVFRNEATDATHDFMFMQVEGLFIDKNVSLAHLVATARTFLQAIFGKHDLDIRVRPGYFPFVEPGLEIDSRCPFCSAGCSTCKQTRWIELLGAGMVHPHVLEAGGVNPDEYTGFAFGMGLERLAMIKYGIHDIRLFRSHKLEFLTQF